MKVLMSALACEPGKGSELEVGWRAMLAAASRHEVWVLTNADTLPTVQAALKAQPHAERIHLEGIALDIDEEGFARLTVPGFHLYYERWQRRAAERALELDQEMDFDIVHHATLASYWTRTGVAAVDKPLVWGPVGGGVDPPFSLLGELGSRGLIEDVGRVVTRRVLGRWGPARKAQRRATIAFAQNAETAARIMTPGQIDVLSNGIVVDLNGTLPPGPRTDDVYFVGRLIPWKAPMLALRAIRHMQEDAVLHFCGDGPERTRLMRAARRWGIQERVTFHGWLSRDDLLQRLATASALLHPAVHEEAGLCVAEALSLGTPVACLAHGGPALIRTYWPDVSSSAVPPQGANATARGLAEALDDFVRFKRPMVSRPVPPSVSFTDALLDAYDRAAAPPQVRRRPPPRRELLGFPRGKPQVFARTASGLAWGVTTYAFGRHITPTVQAAAAIHVLIPAVRNLGTAKDDFEPVCGWPLWAGIERELGSRAARPISSWVFYRSQWEKRRTNVLAFTRMGRPTVFVLVEPASRGQFYPEASGKHFRVPAVLDSFEVKDYCVKVFEALPRFHHPPTWEPVRLLAAAEDVSSLLAGRLTPPPGTPGHYRAIHGDFVPWNLREDARGQLWLLDWEDVGWGPEMADIVRYAVAHFSTKRLDAVSIAREVRGAVGFGESVQEAARFWTHHANLQPPGPSHQPTPGKLQDAARAATEARAFQLLAAT